MIVHESMTRFVVWPYTVRIWRDQPGFGPHDNSDLKRIIEGFRCGEVGGAAYDSLTPKDIITALISYCERLAAVEVVDANGCGELYYPEWP